MCGTNVCHISNCDKRACAIKYTKRNIFICVVDCWCCCFSSKNKFDMNDLITKAILLNSTKRQTHSAHSGFYWVKNSFIQWLTHFLLSLISRSCWYCEMMLFFVPIMIGTPNIEWLNTQRAEWWMLHISYTSRVQNSLAEHLAFMYAITQVKHYVLWFMFSI